MGGVGGMGGEEGWSRGVRAYVRVPFVLYNVDLDAP